MATGLAVAVLGGCGHGRPDTHAQLSATATRFARAVVARDFATACRLVLPRSRATLRDGDRAAPQPSCADALRRLRPDVSRHRLITARVFNLTVTGATAIADVVEERGQPHPDALTFRRSHGVWLLDLTPNVPPPTQESRKPVRGPALRGPKLTVVDQGFSYGEYGPSWGAVVRNTSAHEALGVRIFVTFYDRDGTAVGHDFVKLEGIAPHSRLAWGGDETYTTHRAARIVVRATAKHAARAAVAGSPRATALRVHVGRSIHDIAVRGRLTNPGPTTVSALAQVGVVLRDAGGRIIGGFSPELPGDLRPDHSRRVELSTFTPFAAARSAQVGVEAVYDGVTPAPLRRAPSLGPLPHS